jgi:energy-coupling factor transporter ATP-binding protein EcfA2
MHRLNEMAAAGNLTEVKYLVEEKIREDKKLDSKEIPELLRAALVNAVENNKVDVVRYLLERDIKIDKLYNEEGDTLLHLAALEEQPEIARLLIHHGADLYEKADDQSTPLDIAEASDNHELKIIFKMAAEWQNPLGKKLNFFKIMHYLNNGIIKLKGASTAKPYLVIGNTGAGKSTLIAYLTGTDFEKSEDAAKEIIVLPKGETCTKIGYSDESETLYASLHTGSDGRVYGDCAGFIDDRGEDIRVSVAMNTRILAQSVEEIEGVIVVINANDLKNRATALKALAHTLSQIFVVSPELADSIFFVYTRPWDPDIENIFQKIESIKKTYENRSTKSIVKSVVTRTKATVSKYRSSPVASSQKQTASAEESKEVNEAVEMLKILNLLLLKRNNSMIIDPCDYGDSRNNLINRLKTSVPISKNHLKFAKNDPLQREFDGAIHVVAERATKMIERANNLSFFITKAESDLVETAEKIIFYEEQLGQLTQRDGTTSVDNTKRIESINKQIIKNNAALDLRKKCLNEALSKLGEIQVSLNILDTNIPVTLWSESINEKRAWYGWFGRTEHFFYYRNENTPGFTSVEKNHTGGEFSSTDHYEPSKGEFWTRYETGRGEDGAASVTIKIPKNLVPENIKRINQIKADLKVKEAEVANFQEEVAELEQDNKLLKEIRIQLQSSATSNQEMVKQEKREMEISHREFERRRDKLIKDIQEYKIQLNQLNVEIKESETFFASVRKLTMLVKYDVSLVQDFIKVYDDFSKKASLPVERRVVSLSEISSLAKKTTKESPPEFLCPVSQEIMEDPVSTKCNHTFDRTSIINYSIERHNYIVDCPCCRKDVDVTRDLRKNAPLQQLIDNWLAKYSLVPPKSITDPLKSITSLEEAKNYQEELDIKDSLLPIRLRAVQEKLRVVKRWLKIPAENQDSDEINADTKMGASASLLAESVIPTTTTTTLTSTAEPKLLTISSKQIIKKLEEKRDKYTDKVDKLLTQLKEIKGEYPRVVAAVGKYEKEAESKNSFKSENKTSSHVSQSLFPIVEEVILPVTAANMQQQESITENSTQFRQ